MGLTYATERGRFRTAIGRRELAATWCCQEWRSTLSERAHALRLTHMCLQLAEIYWQRFSGVLDEICIADHWTLHDLRRTARSLMGRAGVRPDIAERVLGHVQQGVEGIYDRHTYKEEKAHALQALAGLIDNILRPAETKVQVLRA